MENTWHAECWKPENREGWRGAMGGFVWSEAYIPEEARAVEYGNLFAYMFRRFGMPEWGSDPHKEIANWYISTPDQDVALCVSPRPSGGTYSFGYMVNEGKYNDRRSDSQTRAVENALRESIRDLLTPVYVRDVPINCIGRVPDDSPLLENECEHFKWAGYGVDHEYFEENFKEES